MDFGLSELKGTLLIDRTGAPGPGPPRSNEGGGSMGIEFLKYLLAAAGLRIDRSAAEKFRPNQSFHLCVREKRSLLNWSGMKYLRGH